MAIRVPSAPQTNLGQQPVTVLQAPRATGASYGGIQGRQAAAIGQAADQSTAVLDQSLMRIRNREDAAARAIEGSALSRELADDYRARLTGNALQTSRQVQEYSQWLDGRVQEAVAKHDGSPESKAELQMRLLGQRDRLLDEAAFAAIETTRAIGRQDQEERFRPITSAVASDPGRLSDAYRQADALIDDYAGLYTPQEELEIMARQRSQIAASAVEGYMARGLYDEAADLAQMPGVVEAMTPEQQSNFSQRLLQARDRENAQWNGYQQNLRVSAAALGTTVDALPTWARVQAAGMQMPQAAPAFQPTTDVGKQILEREAFKSQFGENSQVYQDYVAASEASAKGEPPKLTDIAGMRREFTNMSGDFISIRDAYNKMKGIDPNNSTPATDMSLVFGYMKMLDPASTVREGEYANAQNTTGVPGRILNMYNQAIDGQFLSPQQRQNFLDEAKIVYSAQARSQRMMEQNFARLAERAGMNPDDVIGPLRDQTKDATPPADGGDEAVAGTDQPRAPAVIQYGLDGLPVGSASAQAGASTPAGAEAGVPAKRGGADGQIDPALIDEIAAFSSATPDAGQYFEQMANILDTAAEAGREMTIDEAYQMAKAAAGGQ